ncbi:unnamed protein product [Linum tenue]|uniref:Uncharacterized protein n=2 Tax=Linum TaxID=4005 RepID=A0AAV0PU70_9ROSI|nr:unnamed protein product [Linum tenue]
MVLDSLSSPHRISSLRKGFPKEELGSWSTLLNRHRFLLTALTLLAFLCTIYLYFAITLGATAAAGSCSGMSGKEKALCHLEHAKTSVTTGKLKFY